MNQQGHTGTLGSQSLNYNEGKPRPTLILDDMKRSFEALLKVREYGAKKYDRMNWSLSIGKDDSKAFLSDNKDSIFRHLLTREEIDPESQCYNLAQAALRIMIELEYIIREKELSHD